MLSRSRLAIIAAFLFLMTAPPASAQWNQGEWPMGQGKSRYTFNPTLPGPSVRVTLGSGVSDQGVSSRMAMEATQWVHAQWAVMGRLAAGADYGQDGGDVRTTFQFGALYRVRERGSRSLVAGGGLGLDVRMYPLDPRGEERPNVLLRAPPDAPTEPGRDVFGCYRGSCPELDIYRVLRTNTALTAGWLIRKGDKRERSLLLRTEMLGVSGYAVTLNVGVGPVTVEP